MIRKNNKTCIVCGEKYTFCTSCSDFDFEPRWKAIYHDENCKNIFNATSNFWIDRISKDELKAVLDKCDLSNKENFHHKIKEAIDIVYKEEKIEPVVEIIEEKPLRKAMARTKMKTEEPVEIEEVFE